MTARKSILKGSWYPADSKDCEKEIKSFLKKELNIDIEKSSLKGGVVPHAGWFFSGSIAVNVISLLSANKKPDAVFVFGMHLSANASPRIMARGRWETPFGDLQIHEGIALELAGKFDFEIETQQDFVQDNTIEVQLPFIKYFFPDTRLIPIGSPPSDLSMQIGEACANISEGITALFIGSTDLTHYGPNYGFAPKGTGTKALEWMRDVNDKSVIEAMVDMDPGKVIETALKNKSACCPGAAAAAISAVKYRVGPKVKGRLTQYAASYDRHPGNSFVGYAGIVF